jgi:DNA-directed RNA polymerase subunit M/transcription elongation factor TFIIS
MHFCEKCGNMYYIKIQNQETGDTNSLIYYCRKCGFEDDNISKNIENLCVSKTHVLNNKELYSQVINKYTKLDPTLPRINNIKCPNTKCKTNKESKESDTSKIENEIIYIRYDDKNMKYVYLCCNCDTVWKN